ncbi:hypothetical protein AMS68_004638 [Peltaster fructicola]|uniref:Uncharacterized protein n=1 Tax=Peltaster fructicola TaxID=286661 RepID=A0A6H0XWT5_9PEZI|nr:hypothetical protein AMS68_004638 [Peltaster fructicola]
MAEYRPEQAGAPATPHVGSIDPAQLDHTYEELDVDLWSRVPVTDKQGRNAVIQLNYQPVSQRGPPEQFRSEGRASARGAYVPDTEMCTFSQCATQHLQYDVYEHKDLGNHCQDIPHILTTDLSATDRRGRDEFKAFTKAQKRHLEVRKTQPVLTHSSRPDIVVPNYDLSLTGPVFRFSRTLEGVQDAKEKAKYIHQYEAVLPPSIQDDVPGDEDIDKVLTFFVMKASQAFDANTLPTPQARGSRASGVPDTDLVSI